MDHILAKVKWLRRNPFFKLISDTTLYDPIEVNLNGCPDYDPDHNLDEDSWFKVEQFSHKSYCIDFLKNEFDSVNYDDLQKNQFSKITYLLAIQDDDVYFQKITSSLFVRRKTVVFGEAATIEENSNRLVINTVPDAVYLKESDTLIFKKLATISSIFKGIDELYKEATQEEVREFLNESFIELIDGYDVTGVSKPNRKRIALAMTTLEAMSDDDKSYMLTYINEYCEEKLTFDQDNGKFEIKADDELKFLLYGIEQRFYTTLLNPEKRLANSIITLP